MTSAFCSIYFLPCMAAAMVSAANFSACCKSWSRKYPPTYSGSGSFCLLYAEYRSSLCSGYVSMFFYGGGYVFWAFFFCFSCSLIYFYVASMPSRNPLTCKRIIKLILRWYLRKIIANFFERTFWISCYFFWRLSTLFTFLLLFKLIFGGIFLLRCFFLWL